MYKFYYKAVYQFCQVLFLNNYICDIFIIDKIDYGVYNVYRTPRGAFTPILDVNLQMVYRVFPGIWSEYYALIYGPQCG